METSEPWVYFGGDLAGVAQTTIFAFPLQVFK